MLCAAGAASAAIIVSVEPDYQFVPLTAGTATVDIVADIPEADAIIQWGIDLDIGGDANVSIAAGGIAINEVLFDAVYAPDGDELAALVPAEETPLWGDDILLATITLDLNTNGLADLVPTDDNAYNGQGPDLTEGFTLDPNVGGYGQVIYNSGQIFVPEPGAAVLLAMGGLALLRRRR